MKDLYRETTIASGCIEELCKEDSKLKASIAPLWEKCGQFANGDQSPKGAVNYYTRSTNDYIPDFRKQVYQTNEIDPIIRSIVSFMTRSKPAVKIYSSDSMANSVARSKIAEKIHNAKYELDCERDLARRSAYYGAVFGTAIRKDYWNWDGGSSNRVPVMDEQGNSVLDPETGDVMTEERKTGDTGSVILPPFGFIFDWSCESPKSLPWIIEEYILPMDVAKELFLREGEGFTGIPIGENKKMGEGTSTWQKMHYAVPSKDSYSGSYEQKSFAVVRECFVKPSKDSPTGRMMIKVNDAVVFDSFGKENPYYMPYQNVMWHPYSFFIYQEYIGRIFGRSLVEGLVPLQMRLNEINGAILENANTIAKPSLLAEEKQFKRGVITTDGVRIDTFSPKPSGFVPQKWQGVPLPSQFFSERQTIIDAMVREAGTNFVMGGQPPQGVSAAAAIEMLLENSNSQMSDTMLAFAGYEQEGFTKKLRLLRKFNNLPNKNIITYIRTMDRDALDTEIEGFIGEDLGDGVTVRIAPESMIPKSESMKKGIVEKMLQGPLAQYVAEDSPRGAMMRSSIYKMFGVDMLSIEENKDIQKAEWENDRIKLNEPVEAHPNDNHQIHAAVVLSMIKDTVFLEKATDEQKEAAQAHLEEHLAFMQAPEVAQEPMMPEQGLTQ